MMMDPYGMMQNEKRSKKTKERKEAHCRTSIADLAACKADNQLNQIDFCRVLQEKDKSKKVSAVLRCRSCVKTDNSQTQRAGFCRLAQAGKEVQVMKPLKDESLSPTGPCDGL